MINSSSDNVKKLNSINRRMFITGSLKFFIMIGIVSRLFFLQVKENKKYLTLSDKNRIREWKLAPVRGEFHDYFGNVIAGNFEAYQLHIIPEQVDDFRYVIYRVKDLLELSDKEFKKVLKKKNEIKPWETLIVSDNLSWQKFSKIKKDLAWQPEVSFEDGVKKMCDDISHWQDAPLWTPETINDATKIWFKFLDK